MAELTPVQQVDSSSEGFPPLVLKALRAALIEDEASQSSGVLARQHSYSGWGQDRVLKAALPILRGYLESSRSAAPTAPALLPSTPEFASSIKSQLKALKASKKRKLEDPSLTDEEQREVKKQYKKAKKLLLESKRNDGDSIASGPQAESARDLGILERLEPEEEQDEADEIEDEIKEEEIEEEEIAGGQGDDVKNGDSGEYTPM